MLIAVESVIYVEVPTPVHAEEACQVVGSSVMVDQLSGFPPGEIIKFDVQRWREVTEAEAQEKGLVE